MPGISVRAAGTEHILEMAEITEFSRGKLVPLLFKSLGEQKKSIFQNN